MRFTCETFSAATNERVRFAGVARQSLPPYAIGPLLIRAQRHAAEAFDAGLAPLGIQGKHFGILMTLRRLGPISQQELIARLGTDKSAMVRQIDDLEAKGLVERRRAADRRAFAVTMTAEGDKCYRAAERTAGKVADELLGGLTASERDQLPRLLAKFTGASLGERAPLPDRGR